MTMQDKPASWHMGPIATAEHWFWTKALRAIYRYKAYRLHVETDIVYSHANNQDLTLDLAIPRKGGPFPVVLVIPGGGWQWIAQPELMHILDALFAEHGFVAAEVLYRLAPRDIYPAQINDCKAAVRWLRANAARYNINPERIGALGFSSGAQLACLLGLTTPSDGLEGDGGHPEQPSRVGAVVSFFGPTDFTLPSWRERFDKTLIPTVLGTTCAEHPEACERASPVHYVRPGAPPFLFFHGTEDEVVRIEHSRVLQAKLQAAGDSARLVEVPGHAHGAWPQAVLMPCLEEAMHFLREKLG
jgi:acetyl esterase/lipase